METETRHYPELTTDVAGFHVDMGRPHALTTTGPDDRYRVTMRLSDDDLRQIVQAAYDQHGILAEPSLDRELARGTDWLREFADAWGAAVAEPGRCPCGLPGCSDAAVAL